MEKKPFKENDGSPRETQLIVISEMMAICLVTPLIPGS